MPRPPGGRRWPREGEMERTVLPQRLERCCCQDRHRKGGENPSHGINFKVFMIGNEALDCGGTT